METAIYTIGGGEIFSLIFNGIASVIGGGDTAGHKGLFFNAFVRIGAITGLLAAFVQTMWRDQMEVVRSFFMPFIIVLFVLLTPSMKVNIIDTSLGRKIYTVDHVPFGLGFTAGLFSQIGKEITEKVEQVFSLPDDLKYHKTGAVFASNLIKNAKQFHIVDENISENMRGFVTQCIAYDAMLGRKYTFQDLKNTEDIWGLVTKEPSPVRSFLWRETSQKSQIVTCQVGAQKLNTLFGREIANSADSFGRKLFRSNSEMPINYKAEIYKYLPLSFGYLTGSAKSAEDIIKQQIMIHSVLDGIENKSVSLGNAPNVALRKAYLQQRNTNMSLGELAADTLPVMKILLEAIIYVAFLVVFPLTLLPGGIRTFKTWLSLVVWIQSWGPLYAVLNMIMTVYGKSQSLSLTALKDSHGITIANSTGLMDFHADLSAMAGWAAISVPFLAFALVKGGVAAFNNIATHLGAVSQNVAGRAGDELTSGNFSFGNVSMGTVQANNTNMNQHMLSGSWHSGAFTQNDGRLQETTTASGHQIMDEKISSLASNLNVSESMQSMFQRQAARSETAAQNQMMAASQQESRAYRDMIDLAKHQATHKSVSSGYSDSANTSLGKSLSRIHDKTQSFADQNNLSYDKASQLLAEASVGLSGSFGFGSGKNSIGINGSLLTKGDLSSRTQKTDLYQKAENYTQQENLRDDFNTVRQASRDQRASLGDDIGQRYAESISSSFDKADQFRREASASLQRSQSFTESASDSSQHGWSISDNLNQEYLEWLSHQSYMGSGSEMGMSQAKHIVLNDEGMNRAYQREFLHNYQAGLDNYFDHVQIHSPQDIQRAYQDYSSSTQRPENIATHYHEAQTQGQQAGFKGYESKDAELSQNIESLNSEVSNLTYHQDAQQSENNILSFGNDISQRVTTQQETKILPEKLDEYRGKIMDKLSGDSSNEN